MAILKDTGTGALGMSPSCYGQRPRVCRHGLINRPTAYGCLSGLLTTDPKYDLECALRFQRRVPGDV